LSARISNAPIPAQTNKPTHKSSVERSIKPPET
jgi:hypothetical protein